MANRKPKSKFRKQRHAFKFRLGVGKKITAWSKVIPAKTGVDIILDVPHVQRSIELNGVGDTHNCTMALCTQGHAASFPHKVDGGYIDWWYRRAFISSKLDKNGLPVQCYEYEHNDNIALFQDTPGGQRRLLAKLEKDGPMTIHLLPVRKHGGTSKQTAHRSSKKDGSRTKNKPRGPKLRAAVALGGGV